jgi:UDP-N-acetylmuramate dehydrogenase
MYNSYRLQSRCRRVFFPEIESDFIEIFSEPGNKVIIGGGYNIIFSKEYYEQDFIIVGETFAKIELLSDLIISCEAGVDTKAFSEFALANQLTGAEIFYDIPSSIGGAVVMNAGASGEELKDILLKVRYLDLQDMLIKEMTKEEIGFEYRNSFFQKNTDKIVLKAWLQLSKGDPLKIREKMEMIRDARWAKQPRDLPNCGSVFKRPKGFYVGAMIDELNLKGYTVGRAQISKKHGGFIVNLGGATGQDILAIIAEVQNKVQAKFGVELEVEQRII